MNYKVHKCELRYQSKIAGICEYVNDVTKFMDTFSLMLENEKYNKDSTYRFMCATYLLDPDKNGNETIIMFRVPGATRGNIVVEPVDIEGKTGYKIKEFRFIESTCFSKNLRCYKKDITEAVKKFIGDVIMFE